MPSFLASKGPSNRNLMAIHATAPSPGFSLQRASVSDAASAQALPGKQADGDFGLVQPTAVLGGVVYGKPIPQPASGFLAKAFHHRFARMRTQIVQHQMDGVRLGVADSNLQQVVGKLGGGTAVGHLGKISSRFGLYSAEHVGRAAALVFAIAPRHSSRTHRLPRTNLL